MSHHNHNFNTAGNCACGERLELPKPSTTAPEPLLILSPFTLPTPQTGSLPNESTPPIPFVPLVAQEHQGGEKVNGGSPVGPGFVVYERAPGENGYSREMALQSVGAGWAALINLVFNNIDNDNKYNSGRFMGGVVITQVKEKFGTLRMYHYTTNGDEGYTDGFMSAVQGMSAHICEDCGKPGTIGGRGWIRTLCGECRTAATRPTRTEQQDA